MDIKPIKPDCLKVKETMFDFLRRKKQHQLQQSLKQFNSGSKSYLNNSMFQSASEKKSFCAQVIEQPNTIPLYSNRKSSLGKTMSVTPRKITFGDESEVEYKYNGSARRPLMERISANKNVSHQSKLHSGNQGQHSTKKSQQPITQRQHQPQDPAPYILPSSLQPFIKRRLELSLSQISQKLSHILQAGQLASQKNKQLSVELVKFVMSVNKDIGSTTRVDNNNKKLAQVKYILNAMDSSLSKFNSTQFTNTIELISQFNQSLGTCLHDLQTTISTNLHQFYQQKRVKFHQQKSEEISQLKQQIKRLEKEMGRMNRQVEKEDKQSERVVEEYEERVGELMGQLERMRVEIAEKEREWAQRMQHVLVQLNEQKQSSSRISNQLKTILHQHQQSTITSHSTHQQQLHTRQSFLLAQIQSLKLAFTTDISQLHKLYQSKQLSYQQKITQLTLQLSQLRQKGGIEREVSDKILVEMNNSRMDVVVLRKQNKELLGEVGRVGNDLFRYWLALNDIKALSIRLNIYKYFDPIYMDLQFDPLLFSL